MLLKHGPGRITPAQAHHASEDGTAVLVDVREADEFEAGHAPGALLVPLARLADSPDVPSLGGGRDLMLLCRSGRRSQQAVRLLAERGMAAFDVAGGMCAWVAEGLPVHDVHGAAGTVI
ncbi:rhodanese-like domain-containing protein [Streptomyces sp. NPDC056468]|uniref:rhodanese-like domain-containing protein n=1 Tax=Streptomyces sp. NPDC056468 TaxID=3345830 RepID=UPI0036A1A959